MARDIYQIGIDAVKVLEDWETAKDESLMEIEDIMELFHYKDVIGSYEYNELLSFNDPDTFNVELLYPCRGCDELVDIECDPCDFDPDMIYCGKDPHCCP